MGFNPLPNASGHTLNAFITIASTCGFVLFGYDNGVFSSIIISPWFTTTFHDPSASLLGTISAMVLLLHTTLAGSSAVFVAFSIGHLLGRQRTILVGIATTTIGAIPFTVATNLGELCAGRVICGIGVGIMTSTVGLWQAETTRSASRGRWLVLQLLGGANLGLFLAQWINYSFYSVSGRRSFVFPVAFQFVLLFIALVLVLALPESPRWLAKMDRHDEALQVITRLFGAREAQQRLQQITEADALEKHGAGKSQFSALFANGPTQNFRRLCLACGVMVMHQLAGINSVTYYLPYLIEKFLHKSRRETLLRPLLPPFRRSRLKPEQMISGISSVDSTICIALCLFVVDRIGRRALLFWGACVQCATFFIISVLLATSPPESYAFGTATVVMFFVYYGVNSFTWLGISWAYPAELLPLQIREKGLALGNCCYWLFQFMIVEITPIAIANIYYRYYIILAVFNLCIAMVLWFVYPERARLSLEEIDFQFAEKYGGTEVIKEVEIENGKGKEGVDMVEDTSKTWQE